MFPSKVPLPLAHFPKLGAVLDTLLDLIRVILYEVLADPPVGGMVGEVSVNDTIFT